VWPHRDPAEVFGSLVAVSEMVYRYSGAQVADRHAFATAMLGNFERRVAAAAADPAADGPAVCHVAYHDLVHDPASVVRTVYERFGLPAEDVAQPVRTWLADPGNRPDRHGKWTYALSDYGMTEDGIRDRFRPYREAFGV
jgi:hypothetical protein